MCSNSAPQDLAREQVFLPCPVDQRGNAVVPRPVSRQLRNVNRRIVDDNDPYRTTFQDDVMFLGNAVQNLMVRQACDVRRCMRMICGCPQGQDRGDNKNSADGSVTRDFSDGFHTGDHDV